MVFRKIVLNKNNHSFLKKLSSTQNFNITSAGQLRHSYPLLLNNKNDYHSHTGLVLPGHNYQSHKLQRLFSLKVDVQSRNSKDIKEASSSSDSGKDKEFNTNTPVLTRKEQLKKAIKEYGSVVIIFHVGISLISLGSCYLLISSGLDIGKIIEAVGLDRWITKSDIAAGAGTFAVAYAVHKLLAPGRIMITLGTVPFIVQYLRRIGYLRK